MPINIITGHAVISNYASMYLDNNSTATTIETADTPIGIGNFTSGTLDGFTFTAGSTGAITAYSDGTGKVNVASATHGLVTGDIITIRGTTNYNGVWEVTYIDDDNFSIPDTWVADDGASDWDQPDYLTVGETSAGTYHLTWSLSGSEQGAAGSTVTFSLYQNTTQEPQTVITRKFGNNDVGAFGGGGILPGLSAGDKLFFVAQSSGTNTITLNYGVLTVVRL